ncbi:hypothetical protein TNCV_576191 [Trichonephila clavipes]|nr:hypothetical protein TNCV_576191 [Trichonephila clavipes]
MIPQTSHTLMLKLLNPLIKTSSTQTDEIITKIKCPPPFQPFHPRYEKILSISTPDVLHHHLPPKLNSCRPPLQYPLVTLSLNPPIPTCTDAPSKNMVTPLESSSSIIPTSSSQSVIPPPSDSNTVQDARNS